MILLDILHFSDVAGIPLPLLVSLVLFQRFSHALKETESMSDTESLFFSCPPYSEKYKLSYQYCTNFVLRSLTNLILTIGEIPSQFQYEEALNAVLPIKLQPLPCLPPKVNCINSL